MIRLTRFTVVAVAIAIVREAPPLAGLLFARPVREAVASPSFAVIDALIAIGAYVIGAGDPAVIENPSPRFGTRALATSAAFLLGCLVVSVAVTGIWRLIDRGRAYPSLDQWVRAVARYVLAVRLITYGMSKVIPNQFGVLRPGELLRPLGDFSGFDLLWTFMAASPGPRETCCSRTHFETEIALQNDVVGSAVVSAKAEAGRTVCQRTSSHRYPFTAPTCRGNEFRAHGNANVTLLFPIHSTTSAFGGAMRMRHVVLAVLLAASSAFQVQMRGQGPASPAWTIRVIDQSSRGADGVRLLDVNADGRLDIATGWEEGGRIRAYLNPGGAGVRRPWPVIDVGRVATPEDAVFVDLDRDGAIDVVSACEGTERTMFVHWAPRGPSDYRKAEAWTTQPLPASANRMQWMFTTPLQVDGRNGVDLVSGAKNENATVGWFEAPANARDLASWIWHPIYDAGWIMSIEPVDMEGDGDQDLVVSDRVGPGSGTLWLENPGPGDAQKRYWPVHRIGATGREAMFLTVVDLDRDGLDDVVTAVRDKEILFHRRLSRDGLRWEEHRIAVPASAGTSKSVAAADIDLDGKIDLVLSAEGAKGPLSGVVRLSYRTSVTDREWMAHEISGVPGTKYDVVRLIDLDDDGDLDVLTCEETDNLGVIWYENPAR